MTRARREYVDAVTGERFVGPKAGAVPSGRYVTRTRPARGGKLETVEVDREYVNTADPAYAVDPEARPEIKRAAQRAAQRKAARAKKTVVATFRSPKTAAAQLYAHNPYLAELAQADPGDLVREWMDPIWVRRGRGRTKFANTKKGREILDLSYRAPSEGIKAALQWIIQQSGTKRWREVDWSTLDDYIETLHPAWERAQEGGGSYLAQSWTSGGAMTWYPPGSGRVGDPEALTAAQRSELRRGREQSQLGEIEERLAAARKHARKCLAPADRKVVDRRIRRVRYLLNHPELIADSGFCGERDEPVCTYASLLDEIDKIEEACSIPYDSQWPVDAVTRAMEESGEDAPRTFDFPPAVKRHVERRGVKPRPKPTVRSGRDEMRSLRGALRRDV